MSKERRDPKTSELPISEGDFLRSYNETIPATFPRTTIALLNKFRDEHSALFKHGDMWSLDLHRKKLMDWLPRNSGAS